MRTFLSVLAACAAVTQGQILNVQQPINITAGTRTLVRSATYIWSGQLPTDYVINFNYTTVSGIRNGWRNILHVTSTGNNCCSHGDRVPALFLRGGSRTLSLWDPTNGAQGNNECNIARNNPYQNLAANTEYNINIEYLSTMIRMSVNGVAVCQESRNSREQIGTAYVYASNPWYTAAEGSIKNLYIQPNPVITAYDTYQFIGPTPVPLVRRTNLGAITLPLNYQINFTITPGPTINRQWTNIMHFTGTGSNCCGDGSRIPGIWFRPNTRNLYIIDGHSALPNSGNDDLCGQTPAINGPTDVSINIGTSASTIMLNGTQTCSETRSNRRVWAGVQVWMPDMWYAAADASISNFFITDPNPTYVPTPADPNIQYNRDLIMNVSANVSTLAATVSGIPSARSTDIAAAVTQVTADRTTAINAATNTLSTTVNTLSTQIPTDRSQAIANAVNQLSTQMAASHSNSLGVLSAQVLANTNAQSSMKASILTAVGQLPMGTNGQPSASGTPQVGPVGNAFKVDGGGRSITLTGECGDVNPCQVLSALNNLKNL